MKYCITALSLLIRRINDSFFILILITALSACKKENVGPVNPTSNPPMVIIPPVETGKVTVITGVPVVINNTSISFSGEVTVVSPATVSSKYLVISWYNDTLQMTQNQIVESLTFTKTDAIPGTKYTVKAYTNTSLGVINGDVLSGTTTGFHIGQTYNGSKLWEVWSNSDSAQIISNLLAEKYAFGCQGSDVPGTSEVYGSGMTNTIKINAICPNSAAGLCLSLGSGYYLGSKGDWLRFFQNRSKANVSIEPSAVWTSTQNNPTFAWIVRSSDAATTVNAKMVNTSTVFAGPGVYAFKKIGK